MYFDSALSSLYFHCTCYRPSIGVLALTGHEIPGDVYVWTAVFILPINSALNPFLYTLSAILGKKVNKKSFPWHVHAVLPRSKAEPFLFALFTVSNNNLMYKLVSAREKFNVSSYTINTFFCCLPYIGKQNSSEYTWCFIFSLFFFIFYGVAIDINMKKCSL